MSAIETGRSLSQCVISLGVHVKILWLFVLEKDECASK